MLANLRKPQTKHSKQLELQTFVVVFALGFREKRQPSKVLYMLFGIVTAKKLGWCQKKPERVFPFYYF